MPASRKPRTLATTLLTAVLPLLAALLLNTVSAPTASAASLTEVTGFGTNPSNLRMHVYVPDSAPARPAIVVAIHYCTGTGPGFYAGTEFASLADRYGFLVIYPTATRSGGCYDVSSPGALRRGGGSDPVGIMSMVTYAQQRYGGDPDRVYVTGASSGAMMTNVLLGDYPDVFKAGAAFAGVPFGCFATTDGSGWNSACANGQISRTPQAWGDLARSGHPGYTGARPRMQLWHGTNDGTLHYNNFGEEIKQWTNVLGVSQTPAATDYPQANRIRTRYGATGAQAPVEAISVQGGGHDLPQSGMAAEAIAFFGLAGSSGGGGGGGGGATCTATYRAGTSWADRFNGEVTITAGTTAITTWTTTVTVRSPQKISTTWNGTPTWDTTGNIMTMKPAGNGTLAPGASTTFGFTIMTNGNTQPPTIGNCTTT
ncbi:extracellular catalytic domain type 1 short-chain-length polyhydroxyalkanoate depolymerase [Streptomyces paludis]|uniref:Esterase n=1 Tax=Streptomyces paludis TaxID=2282738 RepID=A0A345HIP3_9ACTN|nr:PHB depolymerase family esterase [Streptomyces paludis]AXG76567.1 esterase [Streptomyces paludis]